MSKLNLDKKLKRIFSSLSDKQQKVISERKGLNGKKRTLQAIGDDLGVTRERIRQIEAQVLEDISPRIKEEFASLFEDVKGFLKELGGVRRADYLISDVRQLGNLEEVENLVNKVEFILDTAGPAELFKENEGLRSFWYLNEDNKEKLMSFLEDAVEYFKKKGKQAILEAREYKEDFNDVELYNFLPISKKFGTNVFDDFGLMEWPEINPKVVRDKAYLVLKKTGEPLHFSDIAEKISAMGIDEEEAHTQTVHNELIKSNKFVLVGRGMYALKEHGFEGGTAKEVIEKMLRDRGPMTSDKVVQLVNEKKILKDNTILLNLQDKNHFKRLDDGKYDVREA